MREWFRTFEERLWLKPDDSGREEAAFIRKALRLRRGSRVLDAPCGAGRVAVHLARAGCEVWGIDLRPAFIERARRRFRREGVAGRFQVADLREIDFCDEFDGICNWQGSFGYFTDEENLEVMLRYARALRNGGRLLIDQPNREFVLRHFVAKRVSGLMTVYVRWDRRSKRVESRYVTREGTRRKESRVSIRLYTPGQMSQLLENAGLTVEALYGSTGGETYGRASKRLILVGTKTA